LDPPQFRTRGPPARLRGGASVRDRVNTPTQKEKDLPHLAGHQLQRFVNPTEIDENLQARGKTLSDFMALVFNTGAAFFIGAFCLLYGLKMENVLVLKKLRITNFDTNQRILINITWRDPSLARDDKGGAGSKIR
jgi:hypothetical protein